jgi:hypothetical protein
MSIGKPYVYECEHVTGTGPAPFSGETVTLAECDKPATKQADGSYKCEEHAARYTAQSARDAQARNYGGESYWAYLDAAEREHAERWPERAEYFLTRSLSEALRGNDGL